MPKVANFSPLRLFDRSLATWALCLTLSASFNVRFSRIPTLHYHPPPCSVLFFFFFFFPSGTARPSTYTTNDPSATSSSSPALMFFEDQGTSDWAYILSWIFGFGLRCVYLPFDSSVHLLFFLSLTHTIMTFSYCSTPVQPVLHIRRRNVR